MVGMPSSSLVRCAPQWARKPRLAVSGLRIDDARRLGSQIDLLADKGN